MEHASHASPRRSTIRRAIHDAWWERGNTREGVPGAEWRDEIARHVAGQHVAAQQVHAWQGLAAVGA